jgi:hypothetical protein
MGLAHDRARCGRARYKGTRARVTSLSINPTQRCRLKLPPPAPCPPRAWNCRDALQPNLRRPSHLSLHLIQHEIDPVAPIATSSSPTWITADRTRGEPDMDFDCAHVVERDTDSATRRSKRSPHPLPIILSAPMIIVLEDPKSWEVTR